MTCRPAARLRVGTGRSNSCARNLSCGCRRACPCPRARPSRVPVEPAGYGDRRPCEVDRILPGFFFGRLPYGNTTMHGCGQLYTESLQNTGFSFGCVQLWTAIKLSHGRGHRFNPCTAHHKINNIRQSGGPTRKTAQKKVSVAVAAPPRAAKVALI